MDDPAALTPRCSLQAYLKHFIGMCKSVALLCLDARDHIFLRPSKSPSIRLKCLGLSNFVPCINGVATFPANVHSQMLACLVQLKSHLTKSKLTQIRAGRLKLEPWKLVLRGCPAWRKIFDVNIALPGGADLYVPPVGIEVPQVQPSSFALDCPGCGATRELALVSLYKKGKWRQLHCKMCYAFSSSRRWACACGPAWVGCSLHAAAGFLCGMRKRFLDPKMCEHVKEMSNVGDTNLIAPPTLDSMPARKRPRVEALPAHPRQRAPKRRLPAEEPMNDHARARCCHHGSIPASSIIPAASAASNAPRVRGCKRKSSSLPPSRRPTPKPKAKSAGLDAVEAFARLRAARANPL